MTMKSARMRLSAVFTLVLFLAIPFLLGQQQCTPTPPDDPGGGPDANLVTVDVGLSSSSVDMGATSNTAVNVGVDIPASASDHVQLELVLDPNNGGLVFTSDYPQSGWTAQGPQSWLVTGGIEGQIPGTYTATFTARNTNTGAQAAKSVTVEVREPGAASVLRLGRPHATPDGMPPGESTMLDFSCNVDTEGPLPGEIALHQSDEQGNAGTLLGALLDNGQAPDLMAGDGVYAGSVTIGPAVEGPLYFVASAMGASGEVISQTSEVMVQPWPATIAESDDSNVYVGDQGITYLADEVLVGFKPGTSVAAIEAAATSAGATIVGSIPSFGIYQLRLPAPGGQAAVEAAIAQLGLNPDVAFAEPDGLDRALQAYPDDAQYDTKQKVYLEHIRVNEAWPVIGNANVVQVAVLDTGIDSNHPDLIRNLALATGVLPAQPFSDDHGHGTHVAGIIAAQLNNGIYTAGIAPNARIQAIKVWYPNIARNGKERVADEVQGIRTAIAKNARAINISLAGRGRWESEANALADAARIGILIAAAAGNSGSSVKEYPAGLSVEIPEVISVGNTSLLDTRSPSSNYGSWVDLAAPGQQIYSTYPIALNSAGYTSLSGTSQAAPMVAATAAILKGLHPLWTPLQIKDRILRSSHPFATNQELGAGRLDVFEAVFNGSFEIDSLDEWNITVGRADVVSLVGPLMPLPDNGSKMALLRTGGSFLPDATIEKTFKVQEGVTSLALSFDYCILTQMYPYDTFASEGFLDSAGWSLEDVTGGGTSQSDNWTIACQCMNPIAGASPYTGSSGWQKAGTIVSVIPGHQYRLTFALQGNTQYESAFAIDAVALKTGVVPSAPCPPAGIQLSQTSVTLTPGTPEQTVTVGKTTGPLVWEAVSNDSRIEVTPTKGGGDQPVQMKIKALNVASSYTATVNITNLCDPNNPQTINVTVNTPLHLSVNPMSVTLSRGNGYVAEVQVTSSDPATSVRWRAASNNAQILVVVDDALLPPQTVVTGNSTQVMIFTGIPSQAFNAAVTFTNADNPSDTVVVNVSVSAVGTPVPNVVGLSQFNAEDTLIAAGLNVGNVSGQYVEGVPAGYVISQNPSDGYVDPGAAIDLVVCRGGGTVTFADPNLEAEIRWTLRIPDAALTRADVAGFSAIWPRHGQVSSLDGVENCVNVYRLDFDGNLVSDLSPLSSMSQLTELNFRGNQISDITPLSGLAALKDLDLARNQLTDIGALSRLSELEFLDIGFNQIEDISVLRNFSKLRYLSLHTTRAKDIGALSGLANLETLSIDVIGLSDVSALSGLSNLRTLFANSNAIADVTPLGSLRKVEELYIGGNQIQDIRPLSSLDNVKVLGLGPNQIEDISVLTGMANLTWVDVRGNPLNPAAYCSVIPALKTRGVQVSWNIQIPDVVGLTQGAAQTELTKSCVLTIGRITQEHSSTPAGEVIAQTPYGGAYVEPDPQGDAVAVDLVISQGP